MVSWELTDDSFFRPDRELMCPLFGKPIPVLIYTDGQAILPDQLQALSSFLDIPPDQRSGLTTPLYDDYQAVRDATGEGPRIENPEQVWKHIEWLTILVPLQGPSGNRFVFVTGRPDWEAEHGVEMLFRNEWLARLGRASGAFLSTCFWDWK